MATALDKNTTRKPSSLTYISLFTGGMGLDIGLERAGFTPVVCNEIDPLAVKTIKLNRPNLPILHQSVEDVHIDTLSLLSGFRLEGIDLLAGGPPCQAFSVFGQRRGLFDGRGRMIFEFVRLVNEIRPKVFLMENVRGLHSMPLAPKGLEPKNSKIPHEAREPGSLLKELLRQFNEAGYRVDCFLVNSVNYGAPQIRERLICIGNKFDLKANFPKPQFSNRVEDNLPPFRTLGDVIGPGFIDSNPEVLDFSPRKLKYLSLVPPGGNWRSLPIEIQKESMGKSWYLKGGRSAYWRRLSFDYPCPTVVTMPNHAGTSMCHPSILRALSVGEMAAVQEFPSDWQFVGSVSDKCRQIGNAVPPRLGEVAGEVITELLGQIKRFRVSEKAPSHSAEIIHLRPHVRTRSYFRDGDVISGEVSYYGGRNKVMRNQLELSIGA